MARIKKQEISGEEKSLTPIVPQEQTIANFNVENLMAKAIEHGLSPETMEKFLAMRQQLKAEWAKEQYNTAMAIFQANCPTIQKTKEGGKTKTGQVAYYYAPLENIVAQVKGLLQVNGFSYSTSMEVLPAGVKVCVKVVHIDGHSEESCMQVPLGTITGVMSSSQQTAAASTFAKRYAFCNAFGILTGDEDNDGATIEKESIDQRPAPIMKDVHYHTPVSSGTMASDKQLFLMTDLLKRKRIKSADIPVKSPWYTPGCIAAKTVTKEQASQMLEWLFAYNPTELPTIEVEGQLSEQDIEDTVRVSGL